MIYKKWEYENRFKLGLIERYKDYIESELDDGNIDIDNYKKFTKCLKKLWNQ